MKGDPPRPFLISFLLHYWRAVQSYRPHLEERDTTWDDDWSRSPFFRRSPSWRFLGVFLGCKANAITSVHSLQDHIIITLIISEWSDRRYTQGKWPLARDPDRSWWHRHTSLKLSYCSPWVHGQQLNTDK